jgi:hypothetical protein
MKNLIDAMRQKDTLTANGAVTHSTSLSECVNLFFLAGAARRMSESDIILLFSRAMSENTALAYQILFWARDCRGGAGEKRFFQVIAKYLSTHSDEDIRIDDWNSLAIFVQDFGSWKDVFVIESPDYNNLNYLSVQLEEHENANLLAKWFPRNGPWFVAMHKYLGKSPKAFRKYLVKKSSTVEQMICAGMTHSVDYSTVPSVAMNKYRNFFGKVDGARFNQFNQDVLDGKEKVNASVLFPHELYQAIEQGDDEKAVEAQWSSLTNYMEGSEERILPVCDVSGSMMGLPLEVCVSLGLYISERNEGIFRDAFITFSEHPKMCYVQGDTLAERMRNLSDASWGYNTNLEATFSVLLDRAKSESLPQSEMPTKLLIISDMEFDEGTVSGSTNLEMIKREYTAAGYEIPQLIFWNVAGRLGNVPSSAHETSVGLVSGFSPAILSTILQGEVTTPHQLMLDAVDTEKYRAVTSFLRSRV